MHAYQHQVPVHAALSALSSAMSSAAAATTTYPFSLTTFTNATPEPFTKPNTIPTGVLSFGSIHGCSATATATASPAPSGAPINTPSGTKAACVISNDADVSDHAFWDLYACCKGDIRAYGTPLPCTGQCTLGDGQSWQDVGQCLSKRNKIVVCKPDSREIGSATPSGSAAAQTSNAAAASSGGAAASSSSRAGASSAYATQATFSKTGAVLFGLMALGSAAGMFL